MQINFPIHKIVAQLKHALAKPNDAQSSSDENKSEIEYRRNIVAIFEKKDRTDAENKILQEYEYQVNFIQFNLDEKQIRLRNMSQGLRSRSS